MVSLDITDRIIEKHRYYLLHDQDIINKLNNIKKDAVSNVLKTKGDGYVEANELFVNWLCEEYEKLRSEDKKSIFIQKPEKLKESVAHVKKHFSKIVCLFNDKKTDFDKKTYSELIIDALGYKRFSTKTPISWGNSDYDKDTALITENYNEIVSENDTTWSAYNFVMELGLKVCPYCNRNYITPLYSEAGQVRGDLDHFLPKSIYPYLSMSIYNLIPCCKFCNSSFKRTEDFTFEDNLNLYEDVSIEELYRFYFKITSYEDFYDKNTSLKLMIDYKKDEAAERLKNNNKIFCIEDMYKYHTDEIKKLMLRRAIYTDEYIEHLYKKHGNLFESKEQMIFLLTDSVEEEEIKNNILGKLKKDIVKELNF